MRENRENLHPAKISRYTVCPTSVCCTNHVHFQNHLSVSKMEISAWLLEQVVMKGEWKCVSMGCGEL